MRKLSFRPGHHAIGVKQSKTFFQPYTSYKQPDLGNCGKFILLIFCRWNVHGKKFGDEEIQNVSHKAGLVTRVHNIHSRTSAHSDRV